MYFYYIVYVVLVNILFLFNVSEKNINICQIILR